MPKISQRSVDMPASPIRKLAPFAADAKKRGIKVYHLNIGQPDLPTPEEGLEALKHVDRKVLEYSPSQGYPAYVEKLVGYYKRYDINLDVDDIIVTCGGSEAVQMAFMVCLNPGDEVIILKNGLALIVDRIAAMNPEGWPMVLTGDLNVKADDPCLVDLDQKMKSARVYAEKTTDKTSFNGWGRASQAIDYVYYSGFAKCKEFDVVDQSYAGKPFISDHYPVYAVLQF